MRQVISVLALGLMCSLAPIAAQGQGGASSGPSEYPDPHCPRPEVKLIKPAYSHVGNIEDSGPVGSYNQKVKIYNREAQEYDACMHAYIDKANLDVKIIQEKANADLKQIGERANASMKAIQDKIGRAVTDASSVATTLNQDAAKLRRQ